MFPNSRLFITAGLFLGVGFSPLLAQADWGFDYSDDEPQNYYSNQPTQYIPPQAESNPYQWSSLNQQSSYGNTWDLNTGYNIAPPQRADYYTPYNFGQSSQSSNDWLTSFLDRFNQSSPQSDSENVSSQDSYVQNYPSSQWWGTGSILPGSADQQQGTQITSSGGQSELLGGAGNDQLSGEMVTEGIRLGSAQPSGAWGMLPGPAPVALPSGNLFPELDNSAPNLPATPSRTPDLSYFSDQYTGSKINTRNQPTSLFGNTNWTTPVDNGRNLPDLPTAPPSALDRFRETVGGITGSLFQGNSGSEQLTSNQITPSSNAFVNPSGTNNVTTFFNSLRSVLPAGTGNSSDAQITKISPSSIGVGWNDVKNGSVVNQSGLSVTKTSGGGVYLEFGRTF